MERVRDHDLETHRLGALYLKLSEYEGHGPVERRYLLRESKTHATRKVFAHLEQITARIISLSQLFENTSLSKNPRTQWSLPVINLGTFYYSEHCTITSEHLFSFTFPFLSLFIYILPHVLLVHLLSSRLPCVLPRFLLIVYLFSSFHSNSLSYHSSANTMRTSHVFLSVSSCSLSRFFHKPWTLVFTINSCRILLVFFSFF